MAHRRPPRTPPPPPAPAALAARLRAAAAGLGVALAPGDADRLLAFAAELLRWNARVDLIGPADLGTVAERHLLDALVLLPLLRGAGVRRLADLGSGAGLPGLALALVAPDLEVVSIEPRARRVAFQRHAVRQFGLGNVRLEAERIVPGASPADHAWAPVDALTARAIAPLPDLLALAAPLVRPGGLVLAMRGPAGEAEAAEAAAAAAALGFALEARRPYALAAGEAAPRSRVLLVYRTGGGGSPA